MTGHDQVIERNIKALTPLLLLQALEAAVLMGCLISLVPVDASTALSWAFDKDRYKVKGDHKTTVYHAIVLLTLAAGFYLARTKPGWLNDPSFRERLRWWRHGLVFFVSLELFALFYILTGQGGGWASAMLALTLLCSILFKVFYPEVLAMTTVSPVIVKAAVFAALLLPSGYLQFMAPGAVRGAWIVTAVTAGTAVLGLRLALAYRPWQQACFGWARQWFAALVELLSWIEQQPVLRSIAPWFAAALIVSLMAIDDPVCVLAKTAFGEHYYHYDFMLMAPAWASGMGSVMGVTHNVFYGLTMPGIIAFLAKLFQGRVDYLSVLNTYWSLCIMYMVALFFCLRRVLHGTVLALAALLLCIRLQLFFTMSYPITAIYPGCSVLRCLWDIPFFVLLYLHVNNSKTYYLAAAAAIVGIAMTYIPTTGIDLYAALIAYLAGRRFLRSFKRDFTWGGIALVLLIPAAAALVILWGVCGNAVWGAKFWLDLAYYPTLFTNGFYSVWFWDNLTNHYYIDFIVGCMIPLAYLGTMLYIGIRAVFGIAAKEEVLTLAVGAYGLGLYHHYLVLAIRDSYFMRSVPSVWVLCYWVAALLKMIPTANGRVFLRWGLLAIAALMLLTNRDYLAFPNLWNSRSVRNITINPERAYPIPWDGRPYFFHPDAYSKPGGRLALNSQGNADEHIFWERQVPDHDTLKAVYAQEFDFSRDAELIDALTKPDEKVALVSSFETTMLIQAKRRPFFFYFPLIASRGLDIRTFPATNLYTRQMVRRTIEDLEEKAPRHVFLEKIFLSEPLPADYARDHEELLAVIRYIKEHYRFIQGGKYLAAMERR